MSPAWSTGQGRETSSIRCSCVAAMLGSVLTLASFLKLVHSDVPRPAPGALARTERLGSPCAAAGLLAFSVFSSSACLPYEGVPLQGTHRTSLPRLSFEPIGASGSRCSADACFCLQALGMGVLGLPSGQAAQQRSRTFVGGEKIADHEESRCTGTALLTPRSSICRFLDDSSNTARSGRSTSTTGCRRLPSSLSCVSTGG